MKNLGYIDALRGVAILSVIWFHCHLHHYSDPAYYSWIDTLGSPAAMGVQLFYVLSAFTLFLSQNQPGNTGSQPVRFFLRRFFRIAPMYYVALVYYLWQMGYTSGQPFLAVVDTNVWGLVANMIFIHGLSPAWINSIIPGGWSVGIEVLFYALMPYLFTHLTNLNRAVLFTTCAMLVGYVLTAVLWQISAIRFNDVQHQFLSFYLPYQLPVFGCGIVAYYFIIKRDRGINPFVLGFAVSVAGLLVLSKTAGRSLLPDLPHTLPLFGSMGFVVILIGLSRYPVRLFVNRMTRYMGKISYSAYLTHFGVLFWLDGTLPESLITVNNIPTNILNFQLKFGLVVLVTGIISTITYHFIEKPTQQFGKRFLQKRTKAGETKYNDGLTKLPTFVTSA